jgi:hypothetical protein
VPISNQYFLITNADVKLEDKVDELIRSKNCYTLIYLTIVNETAILMAEYRSMLHDICLGFVLDLYSATHPSDFHFENDPTHKSRG